MPKHSSPRMCALYNIMPWSRITTWYCSLRLALSTDIQYKPRSKRFIVGNTNGSSEYCCIWNEGGSSTPALIFYHGSRDMPIRPVFTLCKFVSTKSSQARLENSALLLVEKFTWQLYNFLGSAHARSDFLKNHSLTTPNF